MLDYENRDFWSVDTVTDCGLEDLVSFVQNHGTRAVRRFVRVVKYQQRRASCTRDRIVRTLRENSSVGLVDPFRLALRVLSRHKFRYVEVLREPNQQVKNFPVLSGNKRLVVGAVDDGRTRIEKELPSDEVLDKLRLADARRSVDDGTLLVLEVQKDVSHFLVKFVEHELRVVYVPEAVRHEEHKILLAEVEFDFKSSHGYI